METFERIHSIRETNGNFDSCNSWLRLGTSRLHELHESKFPFVTLEIIRSKLLNFSAHVSSQWRVIAKIACGAGTNQIHRRVGSESDGIGHFSLEWSRNIKPRQIYLPRSELTLNLVMYLF